MSEEIQNLDAEGFVKPDSKILDDCGSDKDSRSPKRTKLSADNVAEIVTIKSEENSDNEKTGDDISLIVKSSKEIRDIFISPSSTVSELKNKVAKSFKTAIDAVCLIFEGHVLKDSNTISHYKIAAGRTVHLVVKANTTTSIPTESSPFGLSQLGAIPGLGSMGLGSPNFVHVQKQMESALKQNPDLFLQIMDNPFVQSIMENPRFLQQVLTSNSQMAEMLETNPELNEVINNPEALRASLQQARNPELIQELIQSRADAAAELSKAEDKENATGTNEPKKEAKEDIKPETPPADATGGLFQSPPLQSIMKEMMENPELVKEMFNAPYMASMLEGLKANPEVAGQIMVNNPIFANSTQEQVHKMLPAFLKQMQNPEMQNFVSNPQAMAAMMNIHQGLDQLQQAAPNVFSMFPGTPPVTSLLSPDRPTGASSTMGDTTHDTFSLFMRNMVNAMSHGSSTDGPPEERYKGQLEQMQIMGFINKQENLQALIATFGDVNSAVQRILSKVP